MPTVCDLAPVGDGASARGIGHGAVAFSVEGSVIDFRKLRECLRTLRDEDVFLMLDDAIERLSPEDLEQVVRPFLDLELLRPSGAKLGSAELIDQVRAFANESNAGDSYESFDVTSRNCTKLSRGTLAWIATCCRLFDQCVVSVGRGDASEVLAAMNVLFGLVESIDERDDVLFFADEGGSWLVGIDWKQVLPAWIHLLTARSGAVEFAAAVVDRHGRLPSHARVGFLALAESMATPAQAAALAASSRGGRVNR